MAGRFLLFSLAVSLGWAGTCTIRSFTTPLVRAEGRTELAGEVNLLCTGAGPDTLSLTLNAPVTSPAAGSGGLTEAVLVVDSPTSLLICDDPGGCTGSGANAYLGLLTSERTLAWLFELPDSNLHTVRIANLRVDASRMDTDRVSAGLAGAASGTAELGWRCPALKMSVRQPGDPGSELQALKLKACQRQEDPAAVALVRFAPGFAGALSRPSGFEVVDAPTVGGVPLTLGRPLNRLQLVAEFTNIPSGVKLCVGRSNTGNTRAELVSLEDTGGPIVEVPVYAGIGVAVWEVTAESGGAFDFAVYISSRADAQLEVNGLVCQVAGALGPWTVMDFPGFGDPLGIFTIAPCRTVLVFPFASSEAGMDTWFVVLNTSSLPQAGACEFTAYSGGRQRSTPGGVLGSGSFTTLVLSNWAPGWRGYVIAVCDFQPAHGLAVVTSPLWSTSYVAVQDR